MSSAFTIKDRGLFISFEGIDGAGKSTHIDALADAFVRAGRTVVRTREPGGTPLAEKIRALVLHEPMDALTEALLMFAARRDHLAQVIAPALARGDVVLCDRFTDATFAYQGGGRGFDWQSLSVLERLAQDQKGLAPDLAENPLLQPDLTIWFDLPPDVAARRLSGVRVPDKFEAQPAAFFDAVRAGYARRAAESPARFARINADQPREAVGAEVRAAVQGRGWLS
ncbi:dTMP kinase [Ottowia sp.]|uniref:dTMP kinase n=1 Tax=Ottowia sp. TaxID=1898956 RepID=UPI002BA641FC|nr:dTMP kinase [Ottowia sp.]HOB67663.1 dTMP kinase [Ottowia sp.]HPZ56090.1 dTMP kinase [Ottowia sp.]HQD48775.1 dTMP kinase [Ottowia sp.]